VRQRLLKDLQGTDEKARVKAAWVPDLRRDYQPDTMAVFQGIVLKDDAPSVLPAAFQYVEKHSERARWLNTLIGLLDDQRPDAVRLAALHLGHLKAKQAATPVLNRLAKDPTWELACAVGECRGAEAVPLLSRLLELEDIKPQIVQALGRLRVPEAVPHLRSLLSDKTVAYEGDHPGEPPTLICDLAKAALGL
jgi:HEAT repeat protein